FFSPLTAPTDPYTLSLHDALPICPTSIREVFPGGLPTRSVQLGQALSKLPAERFIVFHDDVDVKRHTGVCSTRRVRSGDDQVDRSEEHTSELQSRENLVCRLLLEK